MKDIIIIADFCGSLDRKSNNRFLYLADLLSNNDKVEIITSDYDHECKKYFTKKIENYDYKITMLHECFYPTNICLRRFYAHFIWGKNVKRYLQKRKKPDVVFCAIPTLIAAYEAAIYCEKNNIRFVIDIQDLWPEAFRMVFNIPILSSLLFSPFAIIANNIYKRADAICAVSDTYCKRALLVNDKCKITNTVYLGTDLTTFDKFCMEKPIIEKEKGQIWIAYCGTLGSSYDLNCIIDAIGFLVEYNICFIIMGDGPKRKEFEDRVKEKAVNAIFTGILAYNKMCCLLNQCDIATNPISHNAAQSIINKHADYVAAGIPIISTQENYEFRELIEKYEMGYNCINGNAKDVAEKIKKLIEDKYLRKKMGENARKCAEERFDRKKTYKTIIREIQK